MRRVSSAALSFCAVVFSALLAGPSYAGDYYRYDDGYSYRTHHHNAGVWYSSSCCYRRVVRHEATVRYVPIERYGYYDDPYRRSSYHQQYRYGYYARPYRYSSYPTYRSETVSGWRDASYGQGCYWRRVRVDDGGGDWGWVSRRVCN